MNDRTMGGPNGPEFRQWLRDNDPDAACMKREAAIVAARLDEVLAEKITIREYEPASLSISPLEVLLLATFTEQTRAQQPKEIQAWWNKAIPLGRFLIGYLIACGLVALVVWLSVRQ